MKKIRICFRSRSFSFIFLFCGFTSMSFGADYTKECWVDISSIADEITPGRFVRRLVHTELKRIWVPATRQITLVKKIRKNYDDSLVATHSLHEIDADLKREAKAYLKKHPAPGTVTLSVYCYRSRPYESAGSLEVIHKPR